MTGPSIRREHVVILRQVIVDGKVRGSSTTPCVRNVYRGANGLEYVIVDKQRRPLRKGLVKVVSVARTESGNGESMP